MFKTIVIVGAPNVGKSTLFNRIVGSRLSITDDIPGTTRDRLYSKIKLFERNFYIVDTGGIEISKKNCCQKKNFQNEIKLQVQLAIEESDLILFVVDVKVGLTANDRLIAKLIYRYQKPVILVVNKVDNQKRELEVNDFFNLGFKDLVLISSEHNFGLDVLFNKIIEKIPDDLEKSENNKNFIKFSIVGRPNVGKSTLVNSILNKKRVIVSEIEGTTKNAIDIEFNYKNKDYLMIDTAGLKKRGKILNGVERYSVLRTFEAIERSNIVLFLIDANIGLIEQDKHIASYIRNANKAVIFLVNKCDQKNVNYLKLKTEIREKIKFLSYVDIIFISALRKKNLEKIFEAIEKTNFNFYKKIDNFLLNNVIMNAVKLNETPKHNKLKIYYIEQVYTAPPVFFIMINDLKLIHFSYTRFIENKIRSIFAFENVTLIIKFKVKKW